MFQLFIRYILTESTCVPLHSNCKARTSQASKFYSIYSALLLFKNIDENIDSVGEHHRMSLDLSCNKCYNNLVIDGILSLTGFKNFNQFLIL